MSQFSKLEIENLRGRLTSLEVELSQSQSSIVGYEAGLRAKCEAQNRDHDLRLAAFDKQRHDEELQLIQLRDTIARLIAELDSLHMSNTSLEATTLEQERQKIDAERLERIRMIEERYTSQRLALEADRDAKLEKLG